MEIFKIIINLVAVVGVVIFTRQAIYIRKMLSEIIENGKNNMKIKSIAIPKSFLRKLLMGQKIILNYRDNSVEIKFKKMDLDYIVDVVHAIELKREERLTQKRMKKRNNDEL